MILKEWSGNIMINGVEVFVNAIISSSPNSPLPEWYGSGTFSSIDEYPKLNEVIMNRTICQTTIGSLFLTNLKQNGTFTFRGADEPRF